MEKNEIGVPRFNLFNSTLASSMNYLFRFQ